ncbi:MBL fold metallo-hydrolase [Alphaproteobacteria bacterium]|nr:MBL fold metallo-hydrolase [Alphaproteobacteria bacterium]MDC3312197.1 MBL fold metallo-hydrolase [Alphaproteobacteria bacterium]
MKPTHDSLIFWGTRGGLPAGSLTSASLGLATSCVELRLSDRHIILDAGSGISLFGQEINDDDTRPIDILIGHYHFDHLIGLPFFAPLFSNKKQIRIFLPNLDNNLGIETIDKLISPPLFPITRDMFSNTVSFHSFVPGETLNLSSEISIKSSLFPHPGQNCGYRICQSGINKLCYISDIENSDQNTLQDVVNFAKDSDHLIIDSSYNDEEIITKKGWGHLSLGDIKIIAKQIPETQIFLYHHDIFKSDDAIINDSAHILSECDNVRLAKQFDKIQLA